MDNKDYKLRHGFPLYLVQDACAQAIGTSTPTDHDIS